MSEGQLECKMFHFIENHCIFSYCDNVYCLFLSRLLAIAKNLNLTKTIQEIPSKNVSQCRKKSREHAKRYLVAAKIN